MTSQRRRMRLSFMASQLKTCVWKNLGPGRDGTGWKTPQMPKRTGDKRSARWKPRQGALIKWSVEPAPVTAEVYPITATEGTDTGTINIANFTTPDLNCVGEDFVAEVELGRRADGRRHG